MRSHRGNESDERATRSHDIYMRYKRDIYIYIYIYIYIDDIVTRQYIDVTRPNIDVRAQIYCDAPPSI